MSVLAGPPRVGPGLGSGVARGNNSATTKVQAFGGNEESIRTTELNQLEAFFRDAENLANDNQYNSSRNGIPNTKVLYHLLDQGLLEIAELDHVRPQTKMQALKNLANLTRKQEGVYKEALVRIENDINNLLSNQDFNELFDAKQENFPYKGRSQAVKQFKSKGDWHAWKVLMEAYVKEGRPSAFHGATAGKAYNRVALSKFAGPMASEQGAPIRQTNSSVPPAQHV
jgi:hypothetical protein